MQKPIVFKSSGYDLYGVFHIPDRNIFRRPVPVVIFFHGFTGTKVEPHRIFVKMSRVLEQRGIASLRFDFMGCGDSEGDFIDSSFFEQVDDAVKAVRVAVSQPEIDNKRVGILGYSLGGAIASYVAAIKPDLRALSLWAPAVDVQTEAKMIKEDDGIKIIKRRKAVDYHGTLLGKRFIDDIPKIDASKEIEKYNGVTMIIHGTKDKTVPLGHSLKLYNTLKKKGLKADRCLIENADHKFSSFYWEQEVLKRTLRFFLRHL